MKASIESITRLPNRDELDLLAEAYVAAFSGGDWEESHNLVEIQDKFQNWFDSPSHQIRLCIRNDEIAGFAVTRTIQRKIVVDDLVNELKEVSGVWLSPEEEFQLKNNIDQIDREILSTNFEEAEAGIFQDVVVSPKFRGTSTYMELMYQMTTSLLQNPQLSIILVYTNKSVSAVVRTLVILGGTKVYDNGEILVYAATKDTIIEKLNQINR